MNDYQLYDDKELLMLISRDDELAFSEIYSRYWKKLFAIAYNRIKEIQQAEDIIQDVFVGLWKNRHESVINSLENYLATAVKYNVFNKIKDIEKAKKFQKSNQLTPVINPQIETALHYKRLLEIIATEIELLPEKCKLVFKYSRENNMSVKEIANIMNISPKTVENQLNKAIKRLKLTAKEI
jgi:RNA polymerase sigma-70 factor, Bacteroides expansion family 1